MKFSKTGLAGLWVIESELFEDFRGSFLKTFCLREFEDYSLQLGTENCYLTRNFVVGTLRGMHYQTEPYAENKLVRCLAGQIFDVAIDVRTDSKTRYKWFGLELSEKNGRALYIPNGFAHGFVTMSDNTMLQYQVSNYYKPEAERGLRWYDPKIGIEWPIEPKVISERDRNHLWI